MEACYSELILLTNCSVFIFVLQHLQRLYQMWWIYCQLICWILKKRSKPNRKLTLCLVFSTKSQPGWILSIVLAFFTSLQWQKMSKKPIGKKPLFCYLPWTKRSIHVMNPDFLASLWIYNWNPWHLILGKFLTVNSESGFSIVS